MGRNATFTVEMPTTILASACVYKNALKRTLNIIDNRSLLGRIVFILFDLRVEPETPNLKPGNWGRHRNASLTFWVKLKSKTRSGGGGWAALTRCAATAIISRWSFSSTLPDGR